MTAPKLIVQIPCYNEEATLLLVLDSIPQIIPGVGAIEVLIIDDGSTDRTLEIAKAHPRVKHIVRHRTNQGLAKSFSDGLHKALKEGADIIVNTDGDNQYPQNAIPFLIAPILMGTHDIVVADRQTSTIKHFSPLKKLLQRIGSRVVNLASGTNLPDAPSGFRAYSRHAAMSLNIITDFSYAMETIVHAGQKRIAITYVPVVTHAKTRESRLFSHMGQHVTRSASAIIRSYTMYHPFRVFLISGTLAILIGAVPYARFLYLAVKYGQPLAGHLQSLIFGAVFIMLGVMFLVIGVVADLLATNRRLIEDVLFRLKKLEYDQEVYSTPAAPRRPDPVEEAAEADEALEEESLQGVGV